MKIQRKQVVSNGMSWTVMSSNERTTEYGGRFFFACRCRSGRPWKIHEHDHDICVHGSAKPLRVWDNAYDIRDLSEAVRCIVGENDGHHPSESFEQYRAIRHPEN